MSSHHRNSTETQMLNSSDIPPWSDSSASSSLLWPLRSKSPQTVFETPSSKLKRRRIHIPTTGFDLMTTEEASTLSFINTDPTNNIAISYNGNRHVTLLDFRSIVSQANENIVYECIAANNNVNIPNRIRTPLFNLRSIGLTGFSYLADIRTISENNRNYYSLEKKKTAVSVVSKQFLDGRGGSSHCQPGEHGDIYEFVLIKAPIERIMRNTRANTLRALASETRKKSKKSKKSKAKKAKRSTKF